MYIFHIFFSIWRMIQRLQNIIITHNYTENLNLNSSYKRHPKQRSNPQNKPNRQTEIYNWRELTNTNALSYFLFGLLNLIPRKKTSIIFNLKKHTAYLFRVLFH